MPGCGCGKMIKIPVPISSATTHKTKIVKTGGVSSTRTTYAHRSFMTLMRCR